MSVGVARKQRCLEKDEAGDPDRCRTTEGREELFRGNWLDEEEEEGGEEDGGLEEAVWVGRAANGGWLHGHIVPVVQPVSIVLRKERFSEKNAYAADPQNRKERDEDVHPGLC